MEIRGSFIVASLGGTGLETTYIAPFSAHARAVESSRSVAWYTIRPSIRSQAKAARSGWAFANSAQVATTDEPYRRARPGRYPDELIASSARRR
jgi:hypothetical protein